MDFLDIVEERSSYIYGIAIVVTIIALAISTRYSLRILFNIRAADDSLSSNNEVKTKTDSLCPCDATGNDGDDEADPDGEEDVSCIAGESVSDRQQMSVYHLDPLSYYEHVDSEINRLPLSVAARTIEQSLTEQQLLEEKEAQCKQLAEIFRLMQEQQDQLGIGNMDDMQEQMKLYAV